MTRQKLLLLIKISLMLLFTLICSSTIAQVEKDTLAASQYFKEANFFLTNKNHAKSVKLLRKALLLYEEAEDWKRVVDCYNKLSHVFRMDSKFENSISNAKKALAISKEKLNSNSLQEALAYDNLGLCYSENFEYENASELHKKALNIKRQLLPKNHPSIGSSYLHLGAIEDERNNLDQALEYYEKNLEISIFNKGEDHKDIAKSYNNVGGVLQAKGEYEKAILYHQKALKTKIKVFGEDNYSVSISYNNLGIVYKNMEAYDVALKYYQKAIEIRKKLFGDKDSSLIGPYHNIGLVYGNMKSFEKAIFFNKKGLSIILDLVGENHMYTAHSFSNLGDHYIASGNYDLALKYHMKSQQIHTKVLGNNNQIVAENYNQIGLTYFKMKKYNEAIDFYEKAITANIKENNKEIIDLNTLLISLKGKAQTLTSLYKQTANEEKLIKSIRINKRSDSIIDQLRRNISNHNDKVVFAQKAKKVYLGAIEAEIMHYDLDKNRNDLNQSFYYLEKSRANALKEMLSVSKAIKFSGLPENTLVLEKRLKRNYALYKSLLNNEELDSIKVSKYQSQLLSVSRKQDSLTEVLEQNYPKYYQLKYNNQVISVEEVQQKLDNTTTLLEFFTTDSTTYAFTISKNNFAVNELNSPGLNDQIEVYRKAITSKNTQEFKTQSHALYQLLIAPIKDQLDGNQLIIVPDGPLWHLNFDLLLTQNAPSNNPKNFPYFLKEYAISYANSATLLFNNQTTQETNKTLQECLAFSFSDSTKTNNNTMVSLATLRDTEDDLPGTREEIRAISNIIDGQYFYGSQAIETNFKKNAEKYNILHLALHGEVDNERPENSRLFFTKSQDTLEDNLLYSHELFALDIPAELTVLSACNTGTGKIAKGEGIMSLGNAFQYAGTKSLLLTSWEVSDQTTPELMKYFYTNLKKGMPKSKALQQAKLSYLQSADVNRTHPFYWGAFYLVGEDTPITFVNNSIWYWGVGIGILALLLGIYFIYQRKMKKPHMQA